MKWNIIARDGKPEFSDRYLVYSEHEEVEIAYYDKTKDEWISDRMEEDWGIDDEVNEIMTWCKREVFPTHYMPIPPKQDTN